MSNIAGRIYELQLLLRQTEERADAAELDLAEATARAERAEAALIDAVALAEELRFIPDRDSERERHRRTLWLLRLQRMRDALAEGKPAQPEGDS